jgi:hypothetical protein
VFSLIFVHTEEVTGSIPVPPTLKAQVERLLANRFQTLSAARPRVGRESFGAQVLHAGGEHVVLLGEQVSVDLQRGPHVLVTHAPPDGYGVSSLRDPESRG